MINLTGIADEAGASLDIQIKAHRELGWDSIESRIVELDGVKANLHEVPEVTFEAICEKLAAAKMGVCGFGSLIGNWGKKSSKQYINLAIMTASDPTSSASGRDIMQSYKNQMAVIRSDGSFSCENSPSQSMKTRSSSSGSSGSMSS
jgi:hypothetical protein